MRKDRLSGRHENLECMDEASMQMCLKEGKEEKKAQRKPFSNGQMKPDLLSLKLSVNRKMERSAGQSRLRKRGFPFISQ